MVASIWEVIDMEGFAPYYPETYLAPRLCDVLNYGFDLGLTDYPIYDESDRERLNQAIVSHFYVREIGSDTPAEFIWRLNMKMREHMPQINEVWHALHDEGTELFSTSVSEATSHSESKGTTSEDTDGKTTAKSKTLNSNAPQVSMVGKNEMNYYDTGTGAENSSSAENHGNQKNTGESDSRSSAKSRTGALSDLIQSYYEGYNNTDLMVFDALEPCFAQVYRAPAVY